MTKTDTVAKLNDRNEFLFTEEMESLQYNLDNEPFFKYCKERINELPNQMWTGLLSNLRPLKQEGLDYINEIANLLPTDKMEEIREEFHNDTNVDNRQPLDYNVLVQLGYKGEVESGYPITRAMQMQKNVMMKNRGLGIDKNQKLIMNANTFAKYLLIRMRLLMTPGDTVYIYKKKGCYSEIKEIALKKICRDILHEYKDSIWNRKWENEYFEALKRKMPYVEQLNSCKELLNLKNGMLDIYTMEIEPHDSKYYSTIQIPIEYRKNAQCPSFKEFLNDIFDNDIERLKIVQEIMGYCFMPEIKIQQAFIFYGSGSNGKSVLADIIRCVVGKENTSNVPLNELGGKFGMQNLPEKLVNISSENEFSKKFNTQNFKTITGGDAINVEKKYKDSFNTVLMSKIIVLVNKLMDTDDYSNGYYRRLLIIPFEKIYMERRAGVEETEASSYMDKNLKDKLLNELDGILNFAMEGLHRLIDNEFNMTHSKVCENALESYKLKQNPVIGFYRDKITLDKSASRKRADFKQEYSKWAINNGLIEDSNIGSTKFWDLFRKILADNQIDLNEKKIRGTMYITGLKISDDENGNLNDYVMPSR